MTRPGPAVASIAVTIAAVLTGCAPDPPSAVVGVEARGCRAFAEMGSGMFVAVAGGGDPLVLTAAHVVAGAREITVRRGETIHAARVVAFDPDMDLAYLAVDGFPAAHPWTIAATPTEDGERGTAYVVRDGEVAALPVTVTRRVQIRTEDVYVEGDTRRPGYQLDTAVEDGDSGGALVVGGEVVGVVWARSRADTDRAYAIDPHGGGAVVRSQLESGDLSGVDLARCP